MPVYIETFLFLVARYVGSFFLWDGGVFFFQTVKKTNSLSSTKSKSALFPLPSPSSRPEVSLKQLNQEPYSTSLKAPINCFALFWQIWRILICSSDLFLIPYILTHLNLNAFSSLSLSAHLWKAYSLLQDAPQHNFNIFFSPAWKLNTEVLRVFRLL